MITIAEYEYLADDIYSSVVESLSEYSYLKTRLSSYREPRNSSLLVVFSEEIPIGVSILRRIPSGHLSPGVFIDLIYIKSTSRREGIGAKVVDKIHSLCKGNVYANADDMWADSLSFFTKMNFEVVNEGLIEPMNKSYFMVLTNNIESFKEEYTEYKKDNPYF